MYKISKNNITLSIRKMFAHTTTGFDSTKPSSGIVS